MQRGSGRTLNAVSWAKGAEASEERPPSSPTVARSAQRQEGTSQASGEGRGHVSTSLLGCWHHSVGARRWGRPGGPLIGQPVPSPSLSVLLPGTWGARARVQSTHTRLAPVEGLGMAQDGWQGRGTFATPPEGFWEEDEEVDLILKECPRSNNFP